jgi:hypothetical protein
MAQRRNTVVAQLSVERPRHWLCQPRFHPGCTACVCVSLQPIGPAAVRCGDLRVQEPAPAQETARRAAAATWWTVMDGAASLLCEPHPTGCWCALGWRRMIRPLLRPLFAVLAAQSSSLSMGSPTKLHTSKRACTPQYETDSIGAVSLHCWLSPRMKNATPSGVCPAAPQTASCLLALCAKSPRPAPACSATPDALTTHTAAPTTRYAHHHGPRARAEEPGSQLSPTRAPPEGLFSPAHCQENALTPAALRLLGLVPVPVCVCQRDARVLQGHDGAIIACTPREL